MQPSLLAFFLTIMICVSPQVVAEQESKLAEQRQLISELQEAVGQLQEEVRSSRHRLRQQRQARDAAQSQAEALQHQELQTRVALECLTSRVSVTPHCRVLPLPGDTPTISSTGCKSLEIARAEAQREMHQGTAALCSRGPASRGQRCRKLGPFASQLFRMRLLRHSQSQQASNTGSPRETSSGQLHHQISNILPDSNNRYHLKAISCRCTCQAASTEPNPWVRDSVHPETHHNHST